eukprot:SAG11_NODE_3044_length_2734_cov_24.397723_4_plen_61_part_00
MGAMLLQLPGKHPADAAAVAAAAMHRRTNDAAAAAWSSTEEIEVSSFSRLASLGNVACAA